MYITTTGLVLREVQYKESSKILTVLTASEGKLTVTARGAKRRGSKTAAATQLLAYSELTLSGNNGRWTLTEAHPIEFFSGLRDELELFSLGSYFAEVVEKLSDEDAPEPEMLALTLNSLYALGETKKNPRIVKPTFELRAMCISGFEPMLDACDLCADEPYDPAMDLAGGVLTCKLCALNNGIAAEPITKGVLDAMRYVCSADSKKLFSFSLGKENSDKFYHVCEKYMLTQLGHGFSTLDFYNSVREK